MLCSDQDKKIVSKHYGAIIFILYHDDFKTIVICPIPSRKKEQFKVTWETANTLLQKKLYIFDNIRQQTCQRKIVNLTISDNKFANKMKNFILC